MRDQLASIKLQLDAMERLHNETTELATILLELSQSLEQQSLTASCPEKRRLLEIEFLNCRLADAILVPTMRKPFDVLAEGLVSENCRDDKTAIELFLAGVQGLDATIRAMLAQGITGFEGSRLSSRSAADMRRDVVQ